MAQRRPVPRGPGQQSPCSWQRLVVGTGRTPTLGGAQKHSHCLWSKLPKIWAEAPACNPCNFYSTQQTLHGPFRGPGPCGMPTKALLLKAVCITGPKHKPLRARAAGGGATGIGALENHAHKSRGAGLTRPPMPPRERKQLTKSQCSNAVKCFKAVPH